VTNELQKDVKKIEPWYSLS